MCISVAEVCVYFCSRRLCIFLYGSRREQTAWYITEIVQIINFELVGRQLYIESQVCSQVLHREQPLSLGTKYFWSI